MRGSACLAGLLAVAMLTGGCIREVVTVRETPTTGIDFQQIIETAKERVYPALVFVKPIREDFASGERSRAEVFGSGVIISADGYLLTNNHVAEKAVQVNCVLGDREQVRATVVGLDPETDLALLKLDRPAGGTPLTYAQFADSDKLEEGQFVMALGSPFGFTRSISLGIISNTKRYIGFGTQYQYNLWLQTDAAINPGNSGGPLVDTDGKVVGINTLGVGASGIGFAIPGNVARDVARRMQKLAARTDRADWPVKVRRAYTGLQLQALKDFNTNTFTDGVAGTGVGKNPRGVLIKNVEAGSPADDAKIRPGDLLLIVDGQFVDGQYVEQLPAIRRTLADLLVDVPTSLTVVRDDVEQAVRIIPVLKGKFEGADFELRRWNFTVKEITKFSNPTLHFQHGEGVFIQGVRYPGCANDARLRSNDIILHIGDVPVKTIADVKKAYERYVNDSKLVEKKVLIRIKRGGFQEPKLLNWTKDYLEEN